MGYRALSFLLPAILVGSCTAADLEKLQSMSKESFGTVAGAGLGGAIGHAVGGKNKYVGLVAGSAIGAVVGNRIGKLLDDRDKAELQRQAALSLETKKVGEATSWTNTETGVSGKVTPKSTQKVAKQTTIVRAKTVSAPPSLELIGDTYLALKSANIRPDPSTSSAASGSVGAGQRIDVVGKVTNTEWYMVSRNGKSVGYVATFLLKPAPQAIEPKLLDREEMEVALKEMKSDDAVVETISATTECRQMDFIINVSDKGTQESDEGSFSACKSADGAWVLDQDI